MALSTARPSPTRQVLTHGMEPTVRRRIAHSSPRMSLVCLSFCPFSFIYEEDFAKTLLNTVLGGSSTSCRVDVTTWSILYCRGPAALAYEASQAADSAAGGFSPEPVSKSEI